MMQEFNDEDIVMVERVSLKQYNLNDPRPEISSILEWCQSKNMHVQFLSVHKYHLKFGIKSPKDKEDFMINWQCSIEK